MQEETLADTVTRVLAGRGTAEQRLYAAVSVVAAAFKAETATLHAVDPATDPAMPDLALVAQRGLPEAVLEKVQRIPYGRGMAGICAVRKAPVTVCNLQTDETGVVRPGARETGVAGAIVIPVLGDGDRLLGTLGIGMHAEHVYSDDEQHVLQDCAARLAPVLQDWAVASATA